MRIQNLPFSVFIFIIILKTVIEVLSGSSCNPRTEQSCGFHNHFYLFFCNWPVPKRRPRIGACFVQEQFRSGLTRKGGRHSEPRDIEVWMCRTPEPGQGSQHHVRHTWASHSAWRLPCSLPSPAPRLRKWIQMPVQAAFRASKLASSPGERNPFCIYPSGCAVNSAAWSLFCPS